MKTYDGSDTPTTEPERERRVADILDRLEKMEQNIGDAETKLNRFSEELFGFVHDEKRVDESIANGYCGMIQYRISNISSILNDMSIELNGMLNELPEKVKQ